MEAASCAQMGIEYSGDIEMFYNGRSFKTHCLAANDAGTAGVAFTRFWNYDGRTTGGFPAGADDVLGEAYGTCEDKDACFQRLPSFVPEQGSEVRASSDGSALVARVLISIRR